MKKTTICLAIACFTISVAQADTVVYQAADGKVINAQLSVGGTSYNVDWYLPAGNAAGLMTYQHGFSRGCGNHRNTSLNISKRPPASPCL